MGEREKLFRKEKASRRERTPARERKLKVENGMRNCRPSQQLHERLGTWEKPIDNRETVGGWEEHAGNVRNTKNSSRLPPGKKERKEERESHEN